MPCLIASFRKHARVESEWSSWQGARRSSDEIFDKKMSFNNCMVSQKSLTTVKNHLNVRIFLASRAGSEAPDQIDSHRSNEFDNDDRLQKSDADGLLIGSVAGSFVR
jgi:hypothetical protein